MHDRVVLPVWTEEGGPPHEIVCDTREWAERQIERLKLGDLAEYEAYSGGA